MNNTIGFYNKYILSNNSYLSLHVVRQTVNKYGNCKNLNNHIDTALNNINKSKYLKIIKEKARNKIKF